jgi:signal recognition particle subunit SRP54
MKHVCGIIDAMTTEERKAPVLIDESRQRRIATGSGTSAHEVRQLLRTFEQAQRMLRRVEQMTWWERAKLSLGLSKLPQWR